MVKAFTILPEGYSVLSCLVEINRSVASVQSGGVDVLLSAGVGGGRRGQGRTGTSWRYKAL